MAIEAPWPMKCESAARTVTGRTLPAPEPSPLKRAPGAAWSSAGSTAAFTEPSATTPVTS
jgi:hypothetical protein